MTVRSGSAGNYVFVATTFDEEVAHSTSTAPSVPGSAGYYNSTAFYQSSWENPIAINTLSKYLTSIPSKDSQKIVNLLEENARSLEDHLDTAYLKISGGTVYGDVTLAGDVNLLGTTSVQGTPIISLLPPTGSIMPFAGTSLPSGYLWCDGSTKTIASYPALYAVCASKYGTATSTDFYLPNLSGRFPLGDSGSTVPGDTGGASTVTLTTNQIPSHTHTQNAHGHGITHSTSQTTNTSHTHEGTTRLSMAVTGATNTTLSASTDNATATNQNTGGGNSHENMPPYLVLNYIIKY